MWRLRNEHVLAPTPKLQPLERQLPHSHTKTCYCKDSGQTQCYLYQVMPSSCPEPLSRVHT